MNLAPARSSYSSRPFSASPSSAATTRIRRPDVGEPGKFTIDLTDPVGSIGGSLTSAGMLAGGLVGGVLGVAGQVGIPGGPNLGDIPEAAGDALGALGGVKLGPNRLPTNPSLGGTLGGGGEANIGAIPGAMMDVVGLPGRAVERTVAGMRVGAAQQGERNLIADAIQAHMAFLMGPVPALLSGSAEEGGRSLTRTPESIPADLQEALDSGKMTADQVADEMVGRNAGFSNSGLANLGAAVVYDPLNLAGGAVGKLGTIGQRAGVAVRAGDAANPAQWMVGRTYNAATHAMTEGQQAVATKFVGPATSGIFHALGSKPFLRLTGKAEELAPEFGQAVSDGVAYGNAQIVRAVMADQIADDAAKGLLEAEQFESPQAVANLIEQRVLDMKELDPKQVERSAEEMMLRVAHKFENKSAEEIASETARKLSRMTGMPEEDAARIIAGDMREAQTVHLGFYGYLGHKLEQAKAASRDLSALRSTVDDSGTILPGQEAASQAENVAQGVARGGTAESGGAVKASKRQSIDYERLTLIAPETLTLDRAVALEALAGQAFAEGVLRYSILRKYHGAAYDEAKVRDLIKTLRDRDALPETVKAQTRDKPNALPSAIGDVRKEAEEFGYELGFSPKSGWRVVTDADGNIIVSDPFVHFVSDATPVTVRNPIGRFVDSLTRGVTQTRIILDSRRRLVEQTRKLGISGREAEEIHRRLLHSARDEGVAPRGLAMSIPKRDVVAGKPVKLNRFDDEFLAVLGPERFAALIEKHDPATLAMRAFEGDFSRIGLTQKVSGRGKSLPIQFGGMPVAAAVAEGMYPLMRFRMNPLFQSQELVESPFWNLLRGVSREGVPDDLAQTYQRLADLEDAKWISEAGYTLNIAGGQGIKRSLGQGPLGRILAHAPDVRGTKESARMSQILTEHPEQFREAVERLNPRIWKVMEESYGTTDAQLVTEAFLRERTAQTGGNLRAALATFDEARPARGVPPARARDMDSGAVTVATDPAYVYRSSGRSLDEIATTGLQPRTGGGRGGPGGGTGRPVVFWSEDAARNFNAYGRHLPDLDAEMRAGAGYGNAGMLLRVRRDAVRLRHPREARPAWGSTRGERVSFEEVPPERIEYLGNDGIWYSVSDAARPVAGSDAAMETVWNAFRYSFEKASTQAFRTHYFSTSRSFLERSINHPYLGLYPASYMWGKVLPEFARFLLVRPFGQKAPLVGLAAWQKVQEAFVASTADPEFRDWLKENKDAVYLANMILPGLPSNMPVNAPAYGRHIAEDTLAGRDVTANTIAREVTDTASYAFGPVRGTETILKGLFDMIDNAQGSVEDNLDNAARMYDGMFGH